MSQMILRETCAAFFVFDENTASTSQADAFPSDRCYSTIRTEYPEIMMRTPFSLCRNIAGISPELL
jgi:hypothetical protein